MKRIYFTVFLVSSSVLMFEVSLTRVFSIRLWYHFAFVVISIAMLGIGSAGTVLAVRSRDTFRINQESNIAVYSLLTGMSIIICYIVSNYVPFDPVKFSWEKIQFFYLALFCIVLSIPFFFSGILIATAFLLHSEKSKFIYGSDLLGAGTGSLTVLFILNIAGPEYAILSASALCLIGALIAGKRNIKIMSLIFVLINLLLLSVHPDFVKVNISPYKRLSLFLDYPDAKHLDTYHSSYSQIDTLKSPAVRFAPGLSLKYLESLPEQTGLAIDGDRIDAITDAGDKEKLRFLEFLPASAAFETGRRNNVLVIDPGGGLHVLIAEYYGSRDIHKVESNPLLVRVIRDDFSELSGGIFDHDTWTGYGRNRLHGPRFTGNNSQLYDLIDLSMTGATVSGAFGISEDYKYTVDAFVKYINALKKDGMISISLYLLPPPRTEFRILATIISAFEQLGIKDTANRLAAIRSWDSMTILAGKSPFNDREIKLLKDFSKSRRFDLAYYPGIKEEETNKYVKIPLNVYYSGFKEIIHTDSRPSFINDYLFDIRPVYDNNPFFNYYLRLANVNAIYEVMGRKWLYFIGEGYLLPVVFIIVLMLSIIIILLPVILKAIRNRSLSTDPEKKPERVKPSLMLPTFIYFAMLGLGFMFVEVSLIQKYILLFENPSYAVAVVLTAILISSGAGSMFSSRFSRLSSPYSLLILSLLIVFYSQMHTLSLNLLTALPIKTRITAMSVMLAPLGFFMGIPFPTGIKLLGRKFERLIPWAWAINACLSVLAPILTIMLALTAGFQTVFWSAALAYFLAFTSLKKLSAL